MNLSKRVVCGFVALGLCMAMAAPTFADDPVIEWIGTNGLWSNSANWSSGPPPGLPYAGSKTVIGDTNYGNLAMNQVELDIVTPGITTMEIFGGAKLSITSDGILNVADAGDHFMGIWGTGGDIGSGVWLSGTGTLRVQDGVDTENLDLYVYGLGGLTTGVDVDVTSDPGYTLYTAVPEPTTMSLLAIGGLGLMLIRRRRRA